MNAGCLLLDDISSDELMLVNAYSNTMYQSRLSFPLLRRPLSIDTSIGKSQRAFNVDNLRKNGLGQKIGQVNYVSFP